MINIIINKPEDIIEVWNRYPNLKARIFTTKDPITNEEYKVMSIEDMYEPVYGSTINVEDIINTNLLNSLSELYNNPKLTEEEIKIHIKHHRRSGLKYKN